MMSASGGGPGPRTRLLALFDRLGRRDQDTLIALADFLVKRERPAVSEPTPAPQPIPRPPRESVVAAIKRLRASYPMLDQARLLNATSSLMTQHILQGRPAVEVIDELERVFASQYEAHRATRQQQDADPPEPGPP